MGKACVCNGCRFCDPCCCTTTSVVENVTYRQELERDAVDPIDYDEMISRALDEVLS